MCLNFNAVNQYFITLRPIRNAYCFSIVDPDEITANVEPIILFLSENKPLICLVLQ